MFECIDAYHETVQLKIPPTCSACSRRQPDSAEMHWIPLSADNQLTDYLSILVFLINSVILHVRNVGALERTSAIRCVGLGYKVVKSAGDRARDDHSIPHETVGEKHQCNQALCTRRVLVTRTRGALQRNSDIQKS